MKYLFAVLLSCISSGVFAADVQLDDGPNGPPGDNAGRARDAKASLYVGSIRSTIRDIKIANKEGATLAGKQAHQVDTAQLIFNGWATFEKDRRVHNDNAAKQNQFARDVNAQVDSYNGTCNGTVDQSTYDWCMGEKARLYPLTVQVNSWKGQVDASLANLNQNVDTLNQAGVQLDKDGNEIHQAALLYVAKYDALVQRIKDFSDKLNDLQTQFDACANAQGTDEKVHDVCGSMFDGNIVQTTETNYPVPNVTFKFYNEPTRCTPEQTFCLSAIK